jgi:hypothetical protein
MLPLRRLRFIKAPTQLMELPMMLICRTLHKCHILAHNAYLKGLRVNTWLWFAGWKYQLSASHALPLFDPGSSLFSVLLLTFGNELVAQGFLVIKEGINDFGPCSPQNKSIWWRLADRPGVDYNVSHMTGISLGGCLLSVYNHVLPRMFEDET